MPIFEYLCGDCNKKFSFLALKAGEEKSARCPSCGSGKLSRLMSRFSVGRGEGGTGGEDGEGDSDFGDSEAPPPDEGGMDGDE